MLSTASASAVMIGISGLSVCSVTLLDTNRNVTKWDSKKKRKKKENRMIFLFEFDILSQIINCVFTDSQWHNKAPCKGLKQWPTAPLTLVRERPDGTYNGPKCQPLAFSPLPLLNSQHSVINNKGLYTHILERLPSHTQPAPWWWGELLHAAGWECARVTFYTG